MRKVFKDNSEENFSSLVNKILSSDKNQFCVMISLVASVGTGCSMEQKILKSQVRKLFKVNSEENFSSLVKKMLSLDRFQCCVMISLLV